MKIMIPKIKINDKVSTWINAVNSMIDILRNATSPTKKDSEGNWLDGNDGFLRKETLKFIEEIPDTYLPINGKLTAVRNTWTTSEIIEKAKPFYLTVESSNSMVVHTFGVFEVRVESALIEEFAEKYVHFVADDVTELKILLETKTDGDTTNYEVIPMVSSFGSKGTEMSVKFTFIGGKIIVEKLKDFS